MRAGNANRPVRVSSIFHSKRLNNDGPPSASSRLVSAAIRYRGEAHETSLNSRKGWRRGSYLRPVT